MDIKNAVYDIMSYIGEDLDREGLSNTADCFKETLDVMLCGYKIDIDTIFSNTMPNNGYGDMILIKDINLLSMCEHHLLPSFGTVDIAYIPNEKISGIGDFIKLVNAFARRLQIQERLTTQIGETIDKYLLPKGVAIRIKAKHFCAKIHNDNHTGELVTNYFSGTFKIDEKIRADFNNC
jgi:GTP cyclohydrolase I